MKKAFVEVRSQHAPGRWPNQGPDRYVAVQVVPEGVARLSVLNSAVAARRGIEIIYCGEGYSSRCATERSMLGAALAEARRIAERINNAPAVEVARVA